MPYIITLNCVDVKDGGCVEVCPVDCIYTGGRMLYIQPDECIDCGVCEPVCPVQAIYSDHDLPADLAAYADANREFFGPEVTGWGSPEGAAKVGAGERDHPLIARLPTAATGNAAAADGG